MGPFHHMLQKFRAAARKFVKRLIFRVTILHLYFQAKGCFIYTLFDEWQPFGVTFERVMLHCLTCTINGKGLFEGGLISCKSAPVIYFQKKGAKMGNQAIGSLELSQSYAKYQNFAVWLDCMYIFFEVDMPRVLANTWLGSYHTFPRNRSVRWG